MAENVMPGPVSDLSNVRESVCVHTRKIFDSCRDKDCLESLRFYPTVSAQALLSTAQSIRGGTAEVLYVDTNVEPLAFNRGFYTVDMRFYYRVTLQVMTGAPRYTEAVGLSIYDKRCILFGSQNGARIFTSNTTPEGNTVADGERSNLPLAVVETVDPIVLDTQLVDCTVPGACAEPVPAELPTAIADTFGEEVLLADNATRRAYVTLGQFSLVRLERETQLLMPVYDYCIPQTDYPVAEQDDPCGLFQSIAFPVSEFFPPSTVEAPGDYAQARSYCTKRG